MTRKSPDQCDGNTKESKLPIDRSTALFTNFSRGWDFTEVVAEFVVPTLEPKHKIRCLEVGVGYQDKITFPDGVLSSTQPTEPYIIAAELERMDRDYSIVLVDTDSRPLRHVQQARIVRVPQLFVQLLPFDRDGWPRYITATQVCETVDWDPEANMKINRDLNTPMPYGFRTAPIPKGLAKRLKTQDVQFVCDNIATVDLTPYGPFDCISCTNLLYLLSHEEQIRALHAMTNALRGKDSILFIDDFSNNTISHCLNRFGGWLTPEIAKKQFGLHYVPRITTVDYESALCKPL